MRLFGPRGRRVNLQVRLEEPLGLLADFGQEADPFFEVSDLAPSDISRSA